MLKIIEKPEEMVIIDIDDVNYVGVITVHNANNMSVSDFIEKTFISVPNYGICEVGHSEIDKGIISVNLTLVKTPNEILLVDKTLEISIQLALIEMFNSAFEEGSSDANDAEYNDGSSTNNVGCDGNVTTIFKKYFK